MRVTLVGLMTVSEAYDVKVGLIALGGCYICGSSVYRCMVVGICVGRE